MKGPQNGKKTFGALEPATWNVPNFPENPGARTGTSPEPAPEAANRTLPVS